MWFNTCVGAPPLLSKGNQPMTATATKPNLDEILPKIEALLNTEGRTPEEAALYVAKAHELLAKYDLDMADIGALKADPRTAVARGREVARTTEGKPDGWKADVLLEVARMFEVRVARGYEYEETKSGRTRRVTTYHLIGFRHDVDAAHYAHSFLVNEIIRLSKEYSRPMWGEIKAAAKRYGYSTHEAESDYAYVNGTHPLKAEVYFVKGAASTVGESLRAKSREEAAARAADPNPNAIVVQKQAEIDEFIGREQFGDRWEEVKAQRADRLAKWDADRDALIAREAEERANETPIQRRRREAREAREAAKEERRWQRESEAATRRYYRQLAKQDNNAVRAGMDAGRQISIRQGVTDGQ